MITTGDILYYVLLGIIIVWAADVFRLWDRWAALVTRVLERVGIRIGARDASK